MLQVIVETTTDYPTIDIITPCHVVITMTVAVGKITNTILTTFINQLRMTKVETYVFLYIRLVSLFRLRTCTERIKTNIILLARSYLLTFLKYPTLHLHILHFTHSQRNGDSKKTARVRAIPISVIFLREIEAYITNSSATIIEIILGNSIIIVKTTAHDNLVPINPLNIGILDLFMAVLLLTLRALTLIVLKTRTFQIHLKIQKEVPAFEHA